MCVDKILFNLSLRNSRYFLPLKVLVIHTILLEIMNGSGDSCP